VARIHAQRRVCRLLRRSLPNGGFRLRGDADAAETVAPAQLFKLWAGSAAFKAGGSLFLLLYCCFSGVWVDVAREMRAERVFVQSSASSTLTAFDGAFGGLWIEYAVGRLSAAKLRGRLPALPCSCAPARSASALLSFDDVAGTPFARLFEERDCKTSARLPACSDDTSGLL
jgi:hypothetical protein